jgi:uncharacterized protein YfaS (alpha-2-macroglobulin family)
MKRIRNFALRGIPLAASIALLVLAGGVLAQDNQGAFPPHVIDVWPYPGEEVLTDQPVVITFDQAMNADSVQMAWQSDPVTTGAFTWQDEKTVSFLPDGGWMRATRYTITIGTDAQAANGLALQDPYEFFVQTIGYLEVSAVIPAPDADGVAADATITVSFDRPVVPLVSTQQLADLPQPLTFDPPIEGQGEWVNTSIYVFTPGKPLSGGTTYTASIPAGLKDAVGATLENTFTWTFETLPPEILNVSPYQGQGLVPLDSMVSVQFSQPMDRPSTEEAFILQHEGQRVPGKIDWLSDNTWLTFTPADTLQIESSYVISLAPTARSASGESQLESGISYQFSTVPYPGISDTYPENGDKDVSPGSGVTFYFKSPMNTDTFERKAEIITPEGVKWEPVVYGSSQFYMDFVSQPETQYTVRFKRGAEDIYGNAIDTDYTFTFTTGKIEPWAALPSAGRFVITNAYRADTRIAMSVQAKPTVSFALYQIDTPDIGLMMRNFYDQASIVQAGHLIRTWSQQLDSGPGQYGVDEVKLASEDGGQLPVGAYYLQAMGPTDTNPQPLALGVVTANLTVKRAPGETLIWVTDIQSAEPRAGLAVSLYRNDGSLITSGKTDADGVFRAAVDEPNNYDSFLYAVAEGDGAYGVWMSWGASDLPDVAGYVYTDRPIYRPGEKVYFRGVMRNRQDMTYTVPHTETVHVTIDAGWGEQRLFDGDVALTQFGTFSGEVDLPEDAPIGNGTIQVHYLHDYDASVAFSVAEFRVPEYKVEVTPDYSTIIQGDPIKAAIVASYYFGGPVSNASLNWNAVGEPAYFNYTGPGRYSFYDSTQGYFGQIGLGTGSTTTDANGQVIAEVINTKAPVISPMTITIEGQTTDESGQYIAGRTSILAHPANVYVGMNTDRYFGQENIPLDINLIAVTPDSQPLNGQKITLDVVEIRWERVPIEGQYGQYDWQRSEIDVESADVVTGSDGTAKYTFTPSRAGIYRVRAVTRDERERVNSSSLQFWVTGTVPVWWGRPSNQIDLVADKDGYKPGDTAEVLVPIPFSGVSYVLMTTERAGIQTAEVFRVEGSTLLYQLPITEEHVPTIYVTATLMKGTDEENLNPLFRTGQIALNVEPVNQRLNVTVTPSATLAQPGDTVTLDVKTTDARGEPVSAEVGVTVTDQAILSLAPPNSGPMEDFFYGYQYDYVQTDVALNGLLDVMTDQLMENEKNRRDAAQLAPAAAMPTATAEGMMAMDAAGEMPQAGGGGAQTVTVRQDFQQTPLWAPRVVTDASGQGSVDVTLPDNLTTWNVDARGVTQTTQVGDDTQQIMATLPLLTRPVVPRFFVVGDKVTLASVINNNTDSAQEVQATLQATGVTFLSAETQTVTIEAGARARVEWNVTIEDVPYVDLTFFAIGQNGYQDAAKPQLATGPDGTIPVYRYTAPDTVGTGGVLREGGSRTEVISLPPRLDTDQGDLTIHLDPSLAVTTVDALNYLKNYKYQCIEQTVSRFLPNVMTYRALKNLGLDDPDLKANLETVLKQALDRLANDQNPDGGWGWFPQMRSDPYITAYAALGLVEARSAGFDVDQGMIDRALNYVRANFIKPTIDTPVWQLNRQAFYLYVFARAGQVGQRDLDSLLDHRLEMDYWARAFLLMAYHEFSPNDPAVPQLVSDLQTGAILSATGAHWEEKQRDWWNWGSDTRTTAIALTALTRVQPDSDILPNVVRWLMVARQGDHWETTQETAWAVMALTDWMVATGELNGNYDYSFVLNGDQLTTGTVTPDTVRDGQVLQIQVKDLLKDQINRLTFVRSEGEGVLYYTAHLNLRLWAAEAKPIDRGVNVTREYFLNNDPEEPTAQAKVGDVITVRVTMTLPQDIYYFVLEDPLPAGTEPVDTSLLTTSQLDQPPVLQSTYSPYWWWGWWYFDHTEMRDEQVNLFADFLPRGTYVYTYQIRASFPGEFQTMPSHAYSFYFPEVFGRGAGQLFTVTEGD